tara:strand:- start:505 stop:930 length:426 start_codon:yes stop_codon:yes gene_type:complete
MSFIGFIKVVPDISEKILYLLINSRKHYPLIPTRSGLTVVETIQEYCAIHYTEHISKDQIIEVDTGESQIKVCLIIIKQLPLDIENSQNKLQWMPYFYKLQQDFDIETISFSPSRKSYQKPLISGKKILETICSRADTMIK